MSTPPADALFVYGTLRDPDILAAVLGWRPDPAALTAAHLPHYRVVYYPGRVYPALVACPRSEAPGCIVFGLNRTDWRGLDAFEGTEYRRERLVVRTDTGTYACSTYLPTRQIASDAPGWTLEGWKLSHRQRIITAEIAAAHAARGT